MSIKTLSTAALAVLCVAGTAAQALAVSDAVQARRTYESSVILFGGTCHTFSNHVPAKATVVSSGRMPGSPVLTAVGMETRTSEANGTPYCRNAQRSM